MLENGGGGRSPVGFIQTRTNLNHPAANAAQRTVYLPQFDEMEFKFYM